MGGGGGGEGRGKGGAREGRDPAFGLHPLRLNPR